MTSLPDIAIAFTKDCLGWENPQEMPGPMFRCVVDGVHPAFGYADLSEVIEAARLWCDEHERNLDIYYVPAPTGVWHVGAGADPVEHGDLCHAMLDACVGAAPKMKSAG